ncbi:MAG: uL15m family ribosomal protein [Candidatus Njordarchaeia archaeon]
MPRIKIRRKRKKSRKMLGSRYHGYGQVGEHKGSGQSGGKGAAGGKDHIKLKLIKEGHIFGSRGFTPKGPKMEINPINIGELVEMIKDAKIEVKKEENLYVVSMNDLPFNRILGRGRVDIPIKIILGKAQISNKAKEKVEAAGGEIIEE